MQILKPIAVAASLAVFAAPVFAQSQFEVRLEINPNADRISILQDAKIAAHQACEYHGRRSDSHVAGVKRDHLERCEAEIVADVEAQLDAMAEQSVRKLASAE